MSYDLTALVGHPETLARIRHRAVTHRPVPLIDGIALVPLPGDELAEAVDVHPYRIDDVTTELGPAIAFASMAGPVAFIHIASFGGTADEAVAVWRDGELVWQARAEDLDQERLSAEALRLVGVVATPGNDEFDTLGLGRHRETEDWIARS